jgi:hypothetical protein
MMIIRHRRYVQTALLSVCAATGLLRAQTPGAPSIRMSEAEKVYVPPRATTRVADGPRKAYLEPKYGSKFSAAPGIQGEVTVTNPFLDTAKIYFVKAAALQAAPDGGLIVSGRAGLDKDAHALGTGYWRVGADGAVTPLHTRSTDTYGKSAGTKCDAPYGQTHLDTAAFNLAGDGSLVKTIDYGVIRIKSDGYVQRLAGAPFACEENGNASEVRGLADGPADIARFNKVGASAIDPQGNVWIADQEECALRRITPDGQVTTVIPPDKVCAPSIAKEDRVGLAHLAWDSTHGELVGGRDFPVALPVHNLYTTVWRIRPSGEFKRVLFGTKVGRSPAKVQIDGITAMAVDPAGRIHFGTRIMTNSSVLLVVRVDEALATVVPVTGGLFRAGESPEFKPRDGPAGRAYFNHLEGLCFMPDGTLFLIDEHLVRRLDRTGQVSTWLF